MVNNCTVVIRNSNERTTDQCVNLVKEQVLEENVYNISEKPFSRAVSKTFDLGLNNQQEWTLAIDADVLITRGSITKMLNLAKELPKSYFFYQGHILDKLHGKFRGGGAHLYRTELIAKVIPYLRRAAIEHRPESGLHKFLLNEGLYINQSYHIFGIHDFGQSAIDVFRKAFFNAKKQNKHLDHLFSLYSQNQNDPVYKVALIGLKRGIDYIGDISSDIRFFENFKYSQDELTLFKDLDDKYEEQVIDPNQIIDEYKIQHPDWRNQLITIDNGENYFRSLKRKARLKLYREFGI